MKWHTMTIRSRPADRAWFVTRLLERLAIWYLNRRGRYVLTAPVSRMFTDLIQRLNDEKASWNQAAEPHPQAPRTAPHLGT